MPTAIAHARRLTMVKPARDGTECRRIPSQEGKMLANHFAMQAALGLLLALPL